ncbi:hypothetical protein BESB_047220 [Besnoitia besnoiti]|uniref:Uncharacterized protein n=1 Tax=Besnoitia besnoiti TaxID=94643 RepID=A0A2A9MLZ7_BESBE|nr:hypothetical protein BESB_047220 [Besnoitia besnoiti]PFH36530.1 hypothetical protein BESB_047220 [Besnoitia besnoiti]
MRLALQDNRAGLPATLIHLGNGMSLKVEYHLDFRLQNIHFKLCTKDNRFIMFFFIPIAYLQDIAIPEELDPAVHASCYDRVRKFVRRPQRAAVLQVSEWPKVIPLNRKQQQLSGDAEPYLLGSGGRVIHAAICISPP